MIYSDLLEKRKHNIIIASHRGVAGANIPCNTLEAFNIALNQGADIVELDVTKSIDGELFVFHPFMDFPHLRKIIPIQFKTSAQIKKLRYVNNDLTATQYGISTLDEAFELLKGKCIINIDKFWQNPKEIVKCLERHNLKNGVIIKTNVNEKSLRVVAEVASDIPYMPMIKNYNANLEEVILSKGIKLVAEELIFTTVDDACVSDEHINKIHKLGLLAWGNSIVYNYKDVISAHKTDDIAILGQQDNVWGWFKNKNFDIIQTDWVNELFNYLNK